MPGREDAEGLMQGLGRRQKNVRVFGSDDHVRLRRRLWPTRHRQANSEFTPPNVVGVDELLRRHGSAARPGRQSLCSTAIAPLL